MFGAAGALVLVAPAAASLSMSAEALLSVLPAAAPVQGATTAASGQDAVLFTQALDQAAPPAEAAPANDDVPVAAPMSITPAPAPAPRLSFADLTETAPPALMDVSIDAPVEAAELAVAVEVSVEADPAATLDVAAAEDTKASADPQTCAVEPAADQPEPIALPTPAPVVVVATASAAASSASGPAPAEVVPPSPAAEAAPAPAPSTPSDLDAPLQPVAVLADAEHAPVPAQPAAAPSPQAPAPEAPAPIRPHARAETAPDASAPATAPEPATAQPQASASTPSAAAAVAIKPALIPAEKAAPVAAERAAADLAPAAPVEAADTAAPAPAEIARAGLSHAAVDATAQIAAQIIRRHDARTTRFEMSLLPEELGRVDVKLDIDSEGRLAARLAFDNPAAALDMRGRADELRRQLEQAGFHVADDAFEFADRDSGSHAFDRGQDSRREPGRAFAHASRLLVEVPVIEPRRSGSLTPLGVDMKV